MSTKQASEGAQASFDAPASRLLTLLQEDFPLTATPFAALAGRLACSEQEVLGQVAALKASGLIRQIGAIYDTRRLGYASILVALRVEPERLDAVAEAINQHPGVSHNYSRDHTLNLWFTLAVPPGMEVDHEARSLAAQPGVLECLLLPALRTFKIRVTFGLGDEAPLGEGAAPAQPTDEQRLTAEDIPSVRALQEDLPLEPRPFLALARRDGQSEEALLESARRSLATGIMRRYGAILRHRQAGYHVNAMVCWQVIPERLLEAGTYAARYRAVSHCYERPANPPLWPYQLYTMIHSRGEDEMASIIANLQEEIRPQASAVLRTVREYKKVRLRYFAEPEKPSP